jgi:hypothetical protein
MTPWFTGAIRMEKARQIDTSRVSVYLLTGEYDPVVNKLNVMFYEH